MLLLLQTTPLPIGLALADRFGCFCLEQEDVWFQGVCLSRPTADKESLICSLLCWSHAAERDNWSYSESRLLQYLVLL